MHSSRSSRLRALAAGSSFFRFLVSGGINTCATYSAYLLLLQVMDYKAAYTIAYILGIALSFAINRLYVFKSHRGWGSVILFPLVYLAQYLVSVGVVWIWVEWLGLPAVFAPLIAVLITVPLTFVLSRFIFTRRNTSVSN